MSYQQVRHLMALKAKMNQEAGGEAEVDEYVTNVPKKKKVKKSKRDRPQQLQLSTDEEEEAVAVAVAVAVAEQEEEGEGEEKEAAEEQQAAEGKEENQAEGEAEVKAEGEGEGEGEDTEEKEAAEEEEEEEGEGEEAEEQRVEKPKPNPKPKEKAHKGASSGSWNNAFAALAEVADEEEEEKGEKEGAEVSAQAEVKPKRSKSKRKKTQKVGGVADTASREPPGNSEHPVPQSENPVTATPESSVETASTSSAPVSASATASSSPSISSTKRSSKGCGASGSQGKPKKTETKPEKQRAKPKAKQQVAPSKKKGGMPSSASSEPSAKVQPNIFKVDPQFLDPDREMRQMFGRNVVKPSSSPHRGGSSSGLLAARGAEELRRKRGQNTLVPPKPNWPPPRSGLTMVQVGDPANKMFTFVWTPKYKEAQDLFSRAVQESDLDMIHEVLDFNPFHADSLLQLALVSLQTGEKQTTEDLLLRCLYAFEFEFHHMFSLRGDCKLSFSEVPNRTFFFALFRYMQLLNRRGCPRTALEVCKLLLSLDGEDPLGAMLLVDFYAIKSGQYTFVLDFFTKGELGGQSVSVLPNMMWSAALAKFCLEGRGSKPSTSTTPTKSKDSKPQPNGTIPTAELNSTELLIDALLMYPSIFSALCAKAGIEPQPPTLLQHPFLQQSADTLTPPLPQHNSTNNPEPKSTSAQTATATTAAAPSTTARKSTSIKMPTRLSRLIDIYVGRNFELWKEPVVFSWLSRCAAQALARLEDPNDPSAQNSEAVRIARWGEEADNDKSDVVYRHLVLSDYIDVVNTVPRDLLFQDEGRPRFGGGGGPADIPLGLEFHAPHQGIQDAEPVRAQTDNPLLLFLMTMFPFVRQPNMPHEDPANDNDEDGL
ncbi:transcription factor 25 [Pelomyxa schiedti]|nr:transcription factor 25 [Pelomyxa schiedti]